MTYWQSTADNNYNALLLKFEKRMSDRYQYLVSYTLSKSEDFNFKTQGNGGNVYGDRFGYSRRRRPGRPTGGIGSWRAASCSCRMTSRRR